MINLLQDYDFHGYGEGHIAFWTKRTLLGYYPAKDIAMSLAGKGDTAVQIVTRVVPDLSRGDESRIRIISEAIWLLFDQSAVDILLRNIRTTKESSSRPSPVHLAISKRVLERDPIFMRMIVEKTDNLHTLNTPDDWLYEGVKQQTPTSLAMYQSSTFE